jgi:flagellar motor switch protein FliN
MSDAPESPGTAVETEQPQPAEQTAQAEQTEQAPFRLNSLAQETPAVEPAGFPDLGPDLGTAPTPEAAVPRASGRALDIRLLSDIPLEVTVELGRAVLTVSDLLALRPGSVVELTASASTVDVVVNGRLVARGDVVVVEDSFGVRVTEIVEP